MMAMKTLRKRMGQIEKTTNHETHVPSIVQLLDENVTIEFGVAAAARGCERTSRSVFLAK